MFLKNICNYVYPNVCGICEKRIFSNSYTCTNCSSVLKYYKERIITKIDYPYDYMINLYKYKGIIKRQICKLKFKESKYIIRTFAELVTKKIIELNLEFDIIIPVPISFTRYLERGYNQSSEISKHIGYSLNKKVFYDTLIKIKNNKRQSELNIYERKNNVLDVYKIKHPKKIKDKKILLLDDIYTTGATINECAKVLKSFGAKKVLVITIAYA